MPLPKEERYTLADVLTWDESERIELIYGVPYLMSPPVRVHQEILGALYLQIGTFLRDKKCRAYPAPFAVRLFEQDGDSPSRVDTMVEPDISVICDAEKLDEIGCKGAPDLVIEVLSPSTQRHDRVTKFNLYQEAGVREYWIVDPMSRTVQVYVLEDGLFRVVESYAAEDDAEVRVLKGCIVSLRDVFPAAE